MDYLTILRTFGKSSLTPAKRVRIRADKFYLVRMQNVVRDQGDGMYLGEGEKVFLLPGKDARERRDAKLNHCNGITEYDGPVFAFTCYPYNGDTPRPASYYPDEESLQTAIDAFNAERIAWLDKMEVEAKRHEATTEDAVLATARSRGMSDATITPEYIAGYIAWQHDIAKSIRQTIERGAGLLWKYETAKLR